MPPIPFHQLSDEPLYCEAVHDNDDDDFYSGSEDDHYEGPLHRRLHIEKKAIEFLSGNVPILLSAALRGPFDRKQWNNPWRSTRAESHAEPAKAQPTRSRQTAAPEEDLPDTQGTSLYPLPSPEITNPPSARKNPYMDEQDYSRIKNWRAAVKSTSVSKDPFWQSQQGDKDDEPPARKRSADPTWLHKRDLKKRRSANPKDPTTDDSPSRVAARTKGSQTRLLHASQMVAQFLRDSSLPEDELATNGRTRSSFPNTSPMANKRIGMPSQLRSGRTTPHRRTRLRQAADTSEDELSLPAATPTSDAARSSTMVSTSPTKDRSARQRRKTIKSKPRPPSGRRNSLIEREKAKKPQLSHSSASQGSGHDGAREPSRTVPQVAGAALERMHGSPQKSFTKQSEPYQDQLLPDGAAIAEPMVLSQAMAGLPSTQQDNSFLFHKRLRSPAGKIERGRSTGALTNGAAPSRSSLQLHATKTNEQGGHFVPGDDQAAPLVPDPRSMMREDSHKGQDFRSELVEESRDPIPSPAADEGVPSSHNPTNSQMQCADGNRTNGEIRTANESPAKVEPDAANDSVEVVQLRRTNKYEAVEEPRGFLQVDGCSQSDSEWSTYLDTQNRTPASSSERETRKKSDDIPVVECGADGLSDPEWSTFINTQDITPVIPSLEAPVDPEEIVTNIAYAGPDIQMGSDQATNANPETLPSVSHEETVMAHQIARAASVSISSPDLAGQAGNASEDSAPAGGFQDAKHSQASVGSIIDAYAEISVLSNETSTMEMPGVEHEKPEADVFTSPCSLPNQIAAAPEDESDLHDASFSSGKLQELQIAVQKPAATESQLGTTGDPSEPDEMTIHVETRNIEDLSGVSLQTPRASEDIAGCDGGSNFLDGPTAGPETLQLQSPWTMEAACSLQMPPQAPRNDTISESASGGLDEAAAQLQSPWIKNAGIASHLFVTPTTCTRSTGSTPDLSILAGQALAMSQPPQNPWGPQTPAAPNLPAAEFEMSIRAFSDFMSPSPVKKRASSNGSILRCSSAKSGVLFKTPEQRKADRRVHFAPLPGEQESFITKPAPDEKDAIYDEEDVSYFDLSGRKTGTVRMPKPTMRAASPPPMETSSVEVGALPDHDQKFAKHFEAMSKRKKPSRKSLRLLPSGSQQSISASQEVGAMAEAFIQASQTRKKGLELAADKRAEAERGYEYEEKTSLPMAMDFFEDQENVEPVDDVSAVLDNLDKFLDDTWGIEMGTDDRPASDVRSKQEKETPSGQSARSKIEDPLFSLEDNVWAD
ncbi:protamine P1 [Diaporthe eres]|uniref:Protamine P1 n=1 Tax=Diaporthe vaccinii TaxID=105482 RepID=A0ABR4DWN2_9PEZI|nr:protamine P1 [Diaporthe eres]